MGRVKILKYGTSSRARRQISFCSASISSKKRSLASFDKFLRKRKVFVLDEFADRIGEGRGAVVDVDVEKRLTFHGTVLENPRS